MMTLQTERSVQQTCFHCGEVCDDATIFHDEKPFCCQGCLLVYELLTDNQLLNYYSLENQPGMKAREADLHTGYAYLDDSATRAKLIDFADDHISKVTFRIPQMHCSACIWLLENLNKLNPGITRSRVQFLRKEVTIVFQHDRISLGKLVELLARIGYAPELQFDRLEANTKSASPQRSLYLKLGIAGFAFGNIMLFSFPEYLDIQDDLGLTLQSFFGYLNILLSLPVLLYSSRDYFVSAWSAVRQGMLNIDFPISLGILAIFCRSTYEILSASGSGYLDSFAGLVFFLLLGKLFQQKSYDALSFDRDYKSYFPISVTKKVGQSQRIISLSDLAIGDQIVVRNQELVPADAVLLSEQAFIDYSFVTGESVPVRKRKGELLFAGGRQVGQAIEMSVMKDVSQSYLTSLWNNDVFQKPAQNALTNLANTVAKYFTLAVLNIALFTVLYWLFTEPGVVVSAVTAVLIIACPCALALSIPFTFGNTLRIFGKSAFFLKNADTVERLAKIDTIVFDKTGTLTWQSKVGVTFQSAEHEPLSATEKIMVGSLVRHSTHPLSYQISRWLKLEKSTTVTDFAELQGKGIMAEIHGQFVRLGARRWILADGKLIESDGDSANHSQVFLEIAGRYRGHFNVANNYRPHLQGLLAKLRSRYRVYLLSGDNDREKGNLEPFFGKNNGTTRMHFNQSPEDKLMFVKKLQGEGNHVMMIGDGLNDAGALKQSDVGVSISEDVASFSPACDAILDARRFEQLGALLHFSKLSYRVVLLSFGISFLYNLIGLSFAVSGMLSPLFAAILMPISSISVVAFATITTRLLAMKLRIN